jgi:glutamate-1-semialdehyde 2,1-aminomutase
MRSETRSLGSATSPAVSAEDERFSEWAHRLIPGGAHTYSRGDDQFPLSAPRAFVRGKGARIWDLNSVEYVDLGMGINNVLIGHAEDEIDDAAVAAIRSGQAFSRPSPLEVEAAEALVKLFPGMEMAKFAKNGSDANSAALLLARATTGRSLIGYDATAPFLAIHDWFIGTTKVNAGVPEAVRQLSVPFAFNDVKSVEAMFAEHGADLAAVILEVCRDQRPAPEFLARLRALCDRHGTLLVFDEVVTGFRYDLHGAHSLFGVVPDLLSIGKAMANGYALAALLGPAKYMERGGIRHTDERVFFLSTTNGPERSALAACVATVAFYQEHDVVGRLHETGGRLKHEFNGLAEEAGIVDQLHLYGDFACRPFLATLDASGRPSAPLRTLFLQETMRRGLFMPWVCPSYRFGDAELERSLEAVRAAVRVYAVALERGTVEGLLVGPPVRPVFRRLNGDLA